MKNVYLFVFLFISAFAFAQERTVKGRVTSPDGQGIPGVSVLLMGTNVGTITDIDGEYQLSFTDSLSLIENSPSVLVFSSVGFVSQQKVLGTQSMIEVQMLEDTVQLEEVVVIGYGSVRKSDLTGSVSSVKGTDLTKIPSANAEQALQGKVAGVQVTSNSGAPGEPPSIRIRGVGTLNNSAPLFVVDGVFFEDITFLNSSDIESMEVLKDASSTAIYGSRGANGVILITTKQGEVGDGRPTVNVSTEYAIQRIENKIDLLNGREFGAAVNDIFPGTYSNLDALDDIDWQDLVFKETAPLQNYQLSVSGGSEKMTYYVGAGIFDQQGIIPKSNYQRISLKINNSYKLSDNVKVGHNFSVSRYTRVDVPNVVPTVYRAWPINGPFITDPANGTIGDFAEVNGSSNALAALEFSNDKTKGVRAVGNFYMDVKFLNNFTFKSSVGIDWDNSDKTVFSPKFFVSTKQQNEENDLTLTNRDNSLWVWENTLSYDRVFDIHRINAIVGYTLQEENRKSLIGGVEGLIRETEDFRYIGDVQNSNGDPNSRVSGSTAESFSILSYLFRVNYTLMDKYLLTMTGRIDGSSKFGKSNQYGFFPSFGIGWNIGDENFLSTSNVITNLKLRGSWGITGNEKIPVDSRFPLVESGLNAVFGPNEDLVLGASLDKTSNEDLKWESTTQTDVGLEIGLFKNKLTAEFDYYRRVTSDILVEVISPGHLGNGDFARVVDNVGEVLNYGFEYNVTWRHKVGDLEYNIGLLGNTVHNEIRKLGSSTGANSEIRNGDLRNGELVTLSTIGLPIGAFNGYKVVGVFQNQGELDAFPSLPGQRVGDLRFEDVDGNDVLDANDRTFIGSPIPDLVFGINLGLAYKGFDFSANISGQTGNKIYNGKKAVRPELANFESVVNDRWTGEGTSNTEPRLTAGGTNFNASTYFIEDGSFVRLRNIVVGYSFPSRLLDKINVKQARIYLKGTNVFTLTEYSGYTPEIGTSRNENNSEARSDNVLSSGIDLGVYPITSVYSLGLNLTF